MASQSLYRKWRSQTFGDLIGQEPIIRTLKNALSSGSLAHAYLFTGPRGTGKTSTARLLAKTVNCSNPINGEPCNQCQQCREITAGNSFNVIEIDAASNRGIDSIRDLREKVMMPPSTGKYKVYVLDEAHMLTTEAFNALLKTLEEPPPYAIFVLATTDVHKMLPTVLSRCQRFDFKRISMRQIVEHLSFVAEEEHVKLERTAAELIARAAAGGMRDALSLLDQAIAYAGEEISLAQVQEMLGVADPRAIHKLVLHVAHLDSSAALHLVHELSEAGADLRQINAQLVEYWRSLMLAKAGADIATILDSTEDEMREIVQVAQLFGLEELTECARVFAQNDLIQKSQGTPQLGLELAFLECIELHRRAQSSQSLTVTSAPATQTRPAAPPAPPRGAASQTSSQAPIRAEARVSLSSTARQSSSPGGGTETSDGLPDWDALPSLDDGEEAEVAAEQQGTPVVGVPGSNEASSSAAPVMEDDRSHSSLTPQQVKDAWEKVKKRVKGRNQAGPKTAAYLNDYAIVGVEGTAEEAIVVIQAAHSPHYNYVNENERYKDIEWALSLEFRQKCRVRLLSPGQSLATPPFRASTSHSANATLTRPSQQSAHLERPASAPSSPPLAKSVKQEAENQGVQKHTSSLAQASDESLLLARTNVVRENTTVVSPQETLEQQASGDPVVQEVMRIFTARIVQVHPK